MYIGLSYYCLKCLSDGLDFEFSTVLLTYETMLCCEVYVNENVEYNIGTRLFYHQVEDKAN